MTIVVIGGEVLGAKLVAKLREHGHEAVPVSPETGVNTVTGAGLDDAVATAAVVIDVSNPPSSGDAAALDYFAASTRNLLDAEAAAGVRHHVLLSAAGLERLAIVVSLPNDNGDLLLDGKRRGCQGDS